MTVIVRRVVIASALAAAATLLLPRGEPWKATRASRIATAPVVVAVTEIAEGRRIDRTAVAVALWPVPTIPAGAYSSVDSVLNRVARINVFKGEAIVPGRLAPEGTGAGLEVRITPGKRAYSIRINDVSRIAGMIQPNSRVDVLLATGDPVDPRGAKPFVTDVRVLAIGSYVQRGRDGRPINSHVVTLELTPEEIEMVAAVATQGTLSLAVPGRTDSDSILSRLRGTPEAPRPVVIAPPSARRSDSLIRRLPWVKPQRTGPASREASRP